MKYNEIIKEITKLPENWDGYGADIIPECIGDNANKFIDLIFDFFKPLGYSFEKYNIPFRDIDITPTPYGSIIIDIEFNNYRIVSTEIAEDSIGWYCKDIDGLTNGPYLISNKTLCNFKELPDDYKLCLKKICFIPSSTYIDIQAYTWVGSSPCEDCENRCEYSNKRNWCEDRKEWNIGYEDRKNEIKKRYDIT